MKREDPNSEHEASTGRAPAVQQIESDTHATGDEYDAEERYPQYMPWNPIRDQCGDEAESEEVVDPKHNESQSEHQATSADEQIRCRPTC